MAGLNALSARRDPAASSSVKQAAAEALQKVTNATALVVRARLLHSLVRAGGRRSSGGSSSRAGGVARPQVNKPTDGVVVVKETRRFAGKDIEARRSVQPWGSLSGPVGIPFRLGRRNHLRWDACRDSASPSSAQVEKTYTAGTKAAKEALKKTARGGLAAGRSPR